MVDTEGVVHFFSDGGKNRFALVHVHVRNASVATHRVVIAAERPDVHVVNFLHSGNCENGAGDFFDLDILRAPFEQNVGGVAQNPDARP